MNKNIVALVAVAALAIGAFFIYKNQSQRSGVPQVAIIIPMEHKALDEIAAGFKEEIAKKFGDKVNVAVHSAQGSPQIMRSILQQLMSSNTDLYAPVGTMATQMTLSMVEQKPIVALATKYGQEGNTKAVNVTGVHDEIDPVVTLTFVRRAFPAFKKVALIYSNNEKNIVEVERATEAAQKYKFQLQLLMVNSMAELRTVTSALHNDVQAILVLKDHLVVSGVALLAQEAVSRHIPVIATDEGSVISGAALALGVSEKSIGTAGGLLAIKALEGIPPANLPMVTLDTYTVFINKSGAQQQGVDAAVVERQARAVGYAVQYVPVTDEKSAS